MFTILNPLRLMMMLALPTLLLVLLAFSGCGGVPDTPIASSCGQCTDCNPSTAYAGGVVTLPQNVKYTIFEKGRKEYGCIGLVWQGQNPNEDPPNFVAELSQDGTYQVLDPTSRTFSADKIGATVAPGVGKVDVLFFVFKVANADAALRLACSNYIKGGVDSCFSDANCLFAWRVKDTPVDGKGGSCSLCHRELCNGKDDDCNGVPDDNGACGRLFNNVNCISHPQADIDAGTPGCDPKGACSCLVTTSGKQYVCAGDAQGSAKWIPLATAQAGCQTEADTKALPPKAYYCAGEALLCDQCEGKPIAWRFKDNNRTCAEGVMIFQ